MRADVDKLTCMIRPLLSFHQLHWISGPQVFHSPGDDFGFLLLRSEDLTGDHLTRPHCIETRLVDSTGLGTLVLQEPTQEPEVIFILVGQQVPLMGLFNERLPERALSSRKSEWLLHFVGIETKARLGNGLAYRHPAGQDQSWPGQKRGPWQPTVAQIGSGFKSEIPFSGFRQVYALDIGARGAKDWERYKHPGCKQTGFSVVAGSLSSHSSAQNACWCALLDC